MVQTGQTVSIHYIGTLDDGTEFDSSRNRGEPISVQVGTGQVIPGFDAALQGMTVGEVKNVSLSPDEAYGSHDEQAVQTVPKSAFPEDFQLIEGIQVQGQGPAGPILATVQSWDESTVTVDMNHPLAGKNLNFEIELVSVNAE
tara:strand:+ start:894 stop:1322 length:429 start_codon:yes stop_codon:yes gene_type:complete